MRRTRSGRERKLFGVGESHGLRRLRRIVCNATAIDGSNFATNLTVRSPGGVMIVVTAKTQLTKLFDEPDGIGRILGGEGEP